MATHLFTYGTLQVAHIFQRVTGKMYPVVQAVLEDYACFQVRGEVYPGIIASAHASTPGTLYLHVDPETLMCLDAFEGATYERIPVRVRLSNGHGADAHAYGICAKHTGILSSHTWSLTDFDEEKQRQFLNAYPFFP